MCRKKLPLEIKRRLILPIRPAVNAQQQRDFGSRNVANRLSQQAVNFSAVLALEADLFGLPQFQFGKQGIVVMRKLTQRPVFKGMNFGVLRITA